MSAEPRSSSLSIFVCTFVLGKEDTIVQESVLIRVFFVSVQCLLPMLNIPLLSWTLECLVASGVQQAFVFVREGSDQVRDWLR